MVVSHKETKNVISYISPEIFLYFYKQPNLQRKKNTKPSHLEEPPVSCLAGVDGPFARRVSQATLPLPPVIHKVLTANSLPILAGRKS